MAEDRTKTASEVRADVLAKMSHEVRTPMNGVLSALELLQRTRLDGQQRELLELAQHAASSLLKAIDDIIAVSEITSGRLEIERVPMSPLAVVEDVADTLTPRAQQKKLGLTAFVDASVPAMVEGDPIRLRQLLFDLVDNAITLAETGEVVLRLSAESAAPGELRLHVRIAHAGLGLIPEAVERSLIEHMGGSVADSDLFSDKPSFDFSIAVGISTATPPAEPDLAGLSLLVVESELETQDMLLSYLATAGAQVEFAADAPAAEALMKRYAAADLAIDAVIVGARQAGAASLRAKPCILLADYAAEDGSAAARQAGFAGYLAKPLRRSTLLAQVAATATRSAGPADALILVAEDNPTNQMVIELQLKALSYGFELAEDGRRAFEMFQQGPGRYGLVLTDIHMPELDGLELAQAIRGYEQAEGRPAVPIVALTAEAIGGRAEEYLAAGINEFMRKPAELKLLQDTLKRLMPRGRKSGEAPTALGDTVLDLDQLRRTIGSSEEAMRGRLRRYLETAGALLAEIERALAVQSAKGLALAARSLVDASRLVGAGELGSLALRLEEAVKTDNWDDAKARQARLGPAFARLRDEARRHGG